MTRIFPDLMLVLCTVIWGGTFPAIKIALKHASPWTVVALRFSVAALIFIAIHARRLFQAERAVILRGAALGVFFFSGFILQTFGLSYTSSSRSAFITEMLVVFIPVVYFILYRKTPSFFTTSGILLVLAGMFLLTSPTGSPVLNRGDWLTLGCALAFSAYIIGVGAWSTPETRGVLATIQCLTVALLALPWFELPALDRVPVWEFYGNLLYLAVPGTVVVILLQMRYQPAMPPARAGVIFALEPVFAMLYAVLLSMENAEQRSIVGALLVTAGVVWSEAGSEVLKRCSLSQQ